MIRLVTLDVNNTLLRFRKPPGEEYCRIAAAHGVTADPAVLTAALRIALGEQNRASPVFGSGGEGWESWWRRVVSVTFERSAIQLKPTQLQAISQDLLHFYSTGPSYSVLPHAQDLIDILSCKDVTLGVITNTDPRIKQVLSDHGLAKHFTFMLDAYTAGFLKPSAKLFEIALSESRLPGLQASEALHIGDSVAQDYLAAREAGWQSWLVAADSRKKCEDQGVSVIKGSVFDSLEELFPALNNI